MNDERLKLTFVIDTDAVGGTEKYLLDLVHHLSERYKITVICPNNPEIQVLATRLIGYGARVIRDELHCIYRLRRIGRWIRHFRHADILHFILPCPAKSRLAMIYARLAGAKPRIATLQLVTPVDHRLALRRWLTRQSIRIALSGMHRIITVSNHDKRQMVEYYRLSEKPIHVIHNALDTSRYALPAHPHDGPMLHPVIALIGRLHPQKGHRVLLEAVKKLVETVADCSVLFVGSGPDEAALRKQVDQLNLSSYVEFLGYRRDIPGIFKNVDIVVLPSLSEGLPFVLLEAMAAGKPVVASELSGIRECVIDETTGVLVPTNSPIQLHDALLRLIHNAEFAASLGMAGQHRVRTHFHIDGMIEKTHALYQESVHSGQEVSTDRHAIANIVAD